MSKGWTYRVSPPGQAQELKPPRCNECDRLRAENERLREALDKVGFYCAGTSFQHVADHVLKALTTFNDGQQPSEVKAL